jgi:hypothetical protein
MAIFESADGGIAVEECMGVEDGVLRVVLSKRYDDEEPVANLSLPDVEHLFDELGRWLCERGRR